ncbi:CHASE2 domain-containing protein [Qipengyuania sp. DGS5-3]|uniref:CHASE2 domain-containing protein n=1 Tax=Qipengyuania sp. DGS5-3 TaxID=3349632 RepID=UPI0036D28548
MMKLFARGWRSVREAGPRRLLITALLILAAIVIAMASWVLPVTADAERALFDTRVWLEADANAIDQDQRVVMVVYDDQTLIDVQKRSPLDRGLLANALTTLDGLGAKAIGIDILFDQPQAEDAQLLEVLRNMKTPVSVGYAAMETNAGDIAYEQQQYLDEFIGALEGSNARAASIRLDDERGVTRRFLPADSRIPPVLGRAMLISAGEGDSALTGYEGSIRYRLTKAGDETEDTSSGIAESLFPKLPIGTFASPEILAVPEARELLETQIDGKYILIGGDIIDYDRVATPISEMMDTHQPPGLQVHAEKIAQMLDGKAPGAPAPIILGALTLLITGMAILTGLLEWGNWRIYLLLAVQFGAILGAPFLLQMQGVDTYGVPAAGWLLGWIIAFSAVTSTARAAGAVQRNFAQGALGKYLPREMASEIIDKPELLALHGEKKEIYVLFSDLEGFTKMSHAIAPEMVAKLLNRYLEMLSQVVLDHGGVIDKFVGDAVVAFWGAPIAKDDDGERAARAGYAVWQAGEAFRAEVAAMDPDLPKVGKTRVGLHFGEAVVGNFGGETRIQYTALGDSMNTAARLEAANKALDSSVMASREFAERSGIKWWRAMGRVRLRGRAQPVDLMEPAPDFPSEAAAKLIEASAVAERYPSTAVNLVEEVAGRYPDDTALQNLLKRLGELDETGTFNLG